MLHTLFYVYGTGTDVGKTIVSSLLCRQLSEHEKVSYWKPVQTGMVFDQEVVQKIAPKCDIVPTLYHYKEPMSPDQAQLIEGNQEAKLAKLLPVIKARGQTLVLEAAGGILVPLNQQDETWLDLCQRLEASIVLVAQAGLGTLNHTSLSIEALLNVGNKPALVVLSGPCHAYNLQSLKRRYQDIHFFQLPVVDLSDQDLLTKYSLELSKALHQSLSENNAQQDFMCESARESDRLYVWHPYTQHKNAPDNLYIARAKGSYLYDENNKAYFDATSSWWVNTIGHGRYEIGQALLRQQQCIDHVLFAGVLHKNASKLSETLVALARHPNIQDSETLSKVFYSDNGSTSIEVAIKMALQYWYLKDNPRQKIVSFKNAYHGDTFGAMSVSDQNVFHGMFPSMQWIHLKVEPFLQKETSLTGAISQTDFAQDFDNVLSSSRREAYQESFDEEQNRFVQNGKKNMSEFKLRTCTSPEFTKCREQSLDQVCMMFKEHHQDIAALIIEPFVQGAAGMKMQDIEWLYQLLVLAKSFGILIIFDEVFVGLGRLGYYFAFQKFFDTHQKIFVPDIVCIAKGLTGGNMPLAATLVKEHIFAEFLDDRRERAFFHGHSYTANPIGISAALASLEIYEKENLCEKALVIEQRFLFWARERAILFRIQDVRVCGAILAFELFNFDKKRQSDYLHQKTYELGKLGREQGILLRPLGNCVYLVPPLTTSLEELTDALMRLENVLRKALLI